MIGLQVADLVLIAGRIQNLDTDTMLDQMDMAAAEAALADAAPLAPLSREDPARAAAALLAALLSRRPLPHGNEQVALVAMAQFLALNGFQVDLDPPEKTRPLVADLAAGRRDAADFADWLASRLSLRDDIDPGPADPDYVCGKQPMLLRWLPTRRRSPRLKAPRVRKVKDPFHRFTDRARTVIVLAQDEARRLDHNYIGTEHVLLGLIGEDEGVAAKALQTLEVTGDAVRREVEEIIGRGGRAPTTPAPFTPRAKKVIFECALREAFQLGHNYVGTEHLLLGLLREGQGVAAQVLVKLGAGHPSTREQVIRLLHGRRGKELQAAPPDIGYFDEQIARVRQGKEAAIDAGDLDTAATLRDAEQQLLVEMRQRANQWMASVDPLVLVEETHRLRGEVERLRALLRRHGIEPDDGPPAAVQAGG